MPERLFRGLIASPPGSRDANELRWKIERHLMKLLRQHGLRAVDRAIGSANEAGCGLVRDSTDRRRAGVRTWRSSLDRGRRLLEVSVLQSKALQFVSVRYDAVVTKRPTRRQRERFRLHEAFYARYDAVAARAYRSRQPPRLGAADRLVLLVAELEADVQNGGFAPYLANKGKRRARAALDALATVGATKTRALLEAALANDVSDSRLETLDDRFYRSREDLAALVMTHLGTPKRRRSETRATPEPS